MEDYELLAILKVIVMLVFMIIVIVFGTLPIRSKKFKKRPLLKAIGATFAGCLFLNVSIMHILPEAADTLQQYLKDGDQDKQVFPLAYLLLMIGFIITVFFTKVLSFHSHQQDHQIQNAQYSQDSDNSPNKKQSNEEIGEGQRIQNQIKQSLISQSNNDYATKNNGRKYLEDENYQNKTPKKKGESHHKHQHKHQHSHHDHQNDHGHQEHGHQHNHKLQNKSVLNEAFILTLAIYFHTIFQGIAIGVQNSITGFLSTAVAIAFHKWADALSMGLHYRSKNVTKKLSYTLIIIQSVLNALSIGLGWMIASYGDVAEAIFLSISAGTFLAISTLEMLGQQLHHRQYMVVKFLLLIGATGFVASIWFLENSIFNN